MNFIIYFTLCIIVLLSIFSPLSLPFRPLFNFCLLISLLPLLAHHIYYRRPWLTILAKASDLKHIPVAQTHTKPQKKPSYISFTMSGSMSLLERLEALMENYEGIKPK